MSDYAACMNADCPQRESCARYRMEFGEWQTVADFAPRDDGRCGHFWAVEAAPWVLVTIEQAEARGAWLRQEVKP